MVRHRICRAHLYGCEKTMQADMFSVMPPTINISGLRAISLANMDRLVQYYLS